ncbi:hypothetical protein BY996DRAFT_6412101 [Phakopsora pachyrhizi]|nr:hypothetical protein BY996DRAFT_6412101 [Phakopsora pachyrhizi]
MNVGSGSISSSSSQLRSENEKIVRRETHINLANRAKGPSRDITGFSPKNRTGPMGRGSKKTSAKNLALGQRGTWQRVKLGKMMVGQTTRVVLKPAGSSDERRQNTKLEGYEAWSRVVKKAWLSY